MSLFNSNQSLIGLLGQQNTNQNQFNISNNATQQAVIQQIMDRIASLQQAGEDRRLRDRIAKQQQLSHFLELTQQSVDMANRNRLAKRGLEIDEKRLALSEAEAEKDRAHQLAMQKKELDTRKTLAERGFELEENRDLDNLSMRQQELLQAKESLDKRLKVEEKRLGNDIKNDDRNHQYRLMKDLQDNLKFAMTYKASMRDQDLQELRTVAQLDLHDDRIMNLLSEKLGGEFVEKLQERTGLPFLGDYDAWLDSELAKPEVFKSQRGQKLIEQKMKREEHAARMLLSEQKDVTPADKRREDLLSQDLANVSSYSALPTPEQLKQTESFLLSAERLGSELPSNVRNQVLVARQNLLSQAKKELKDLKWGDENIDSIITSLPNKFRLGLGNNPEQFAQALEEAQARIMDLGDISSRLKLGRELTPSRFEAVKKLNNFREASDFMEGYLIPDYKPMVGAQPLIGRSYGRYRNFKLGDRSEYEQFLKLYEDTK